MDEQRCGASTDLELPHLALQLLEFHLELLHVLAAVAALGLVRLGEQTNSGRSHGACVLYLAPATRHLESIQQAVPQLVCNQNPDDIPKCYVCMFMNLIRQLLTGEWKAEVSIKLAAS